MRKNFFQTFPCKYFTQVMTKNPPEEVCPATTLKITRYLHDEMKCTTRMWQDKWMPGYWNLSWIFLTLRLIFCKYPSYFLPMSPAKLTRWKKRRKKSYIPVSFLPTIKRCVQDIILGFQMFHRGRSSDKMTIRFSLISSVSKNITSTLLHWYFALWGNIFHIIAWDIGTSNSWYIGNGQLELTCRAHRKLVP